MKNQIFSVITGTGSYIPARCIKNEDFLDYEFLDSSGKSLGKSNQEIIEKFFDITTIAERRYAQDNLVTSDLAYYAALETIESAKIDKEQLDYIIVAHNFGDVKNQQKSLDIVPSLASRVKYLLGIENPNCIAYDLPFGCPGWLQAMIQADYFLRSGDVQKILIIGAETVSRVCDPHDRDSMLYADGAGAVILEAIKGDNPVGIVAHKTRSDTLLHSKMLFMGKSYKTNGQIHSDSAFLKMHGRKLYQYALENVPPAIKDCLEKSNTKIQDVKKILIHQANGKMDEAILKRLFNLYNIEDIPEGIMPMTIDWLGNSSVATIPTLLDLIWKGNFKPHEIQKGDTIVFASVGAGMNINAAVYKV
ncbi:MAG: ketoacyl-ACP synthase III [Saprospiraceae bacterium]|nr:ketoacyl-ACP synthase III [Saprospiraceae bacterium]